MGNILNYPAPETAKDFYPPVDAYDHKKCALLRYYDLPGIVGLMVAYTSEATNGFYAVETQDTDGWIIRHIAISPDGLILIDPATQIRRAYPTSEVKIVGRIIQFIANWETGERWELIHGPAMSKRVALPLKIEQTATTLLN